jgi:hypothetical protein
MALDALREVVQEAGSRHMDPNAGKSGGCKYVAIDDKDKPECIIGRALHHLGVEISVLREMDCSLEPVIEVGGSSVLSNHDVTMDPGARVLFTAAQTAQDKSEMWGDALEKVEDRAHIMGLPAIGGLL